MSENNRLTKSGTGPATDDRKARLAEQLRANLRRRKMQARHRHEEGAIEGEAGPDGRKTPDS